MIVQEHRGEPDGLIVSHLPYGPTAYFTISGVVMRHEVAGLEHCPQAYPHLIFHNLKTTLGLRVSSSDGRMIEIGHYIINYEY